MAVKIDRYTSLYVLLRSQKAEMKPVEEGLTTRTVVHRYTPEGKDLPSFLYGNFDTLNDMIFRFREEAESKKRKIFGRWNPWAKDSINNLSLLKLIEAETEMASEEYHRQAGHENHPSIDYSIVYGIEKFTIVEKPPSTYNYRSTLDEMLKGNHLKF